MCDPFTSEPEWVTDPPGREAYCIAAYGPVDEYRDSLEIPYGPDVLYPPPPEK